MRRLALVTLSGRVLVLGLALVLAAPFIAPATSGPTALAANPAAAANNPAGHLRPDPALAHPIKLREPTAKEIAAVHLKPGTGPCVGLFEAANYVAGRLPDKHPCSHGPDGIIRTPASASSTLLDGSNDYVPPPIPCFTSGPVVKVFYIYQSGQPNRLAALKARILKTVAGADDSFSRSADTVGLAVRHVHWLMDANCDLSLTAVAVSTTAFEEGLFSIADALANTGKLAAGQKALIFSDDPGTSCAGTAGIASVYTDDSPLASNLANTGLFWNAGAPEFGFPGYWSESIAQVMGWCLNDPTLSLTDLSDIAAHEVMHTMGAVQDSAPHSSLAGHCSDGDDIMCYDDEGPPGLDSICPAEFPRAFDCNKNDYFNPSAPAGSYLATHWNTANNVFLAKSAPTSKSTTAPRVAITAPVAGATATGDFALSATATDPGAAAITRVDFYANGTLVVSDTSAPYSVPLVTTPSGDVYPYPDGALTVDAVAYDAAGRWSFAPEIALTLTNPRDGLTAPGDLAIVTLTAPAVSATVDGRTTFNAVVTGEAAGSVVERLTFLVDGISIGTDDAAPYALAWNSATVTLGRHTVSAVAAYSDGSNRTSDPRSITVVSSGGPAYPVAHLTGLPIWLTTTSVALSWSATHGTAALASYDVRYRRAAWNGAFGAYTTWRAATAATSGVFVGAPGSTDCFSVRARDAAGRLSSWTAETCTALPLDDRSLTLHGTWTRSLSTAYYRGTYLRTSSHGAYLTRTGVVARRIALLVTTCPTCGTVKVYWGSTLLKTVSLYSSTTKYKRLISVAVFSSVRTGTLKITVSSYSKKVFIDGIAVRRVY